MADIHPETISYLEAHGTGTLMGDPLEIDALNKAYGIYTDKKNYCAIGSLKGNIGHLIEASGIAGFIKTVLSLHHGYIPPSLHFETPNPNIDFENSPFFVNTTLKNWDKTDNPRRAGISSFGMGGTNAHVILEESPEIFPVLTSKKHHLFTLSAKKSSALKKMVSNLENYLNQHHSTSLEDSAYTLRFGRNDFDYRYSFVCKNVEDAISELNAYESFIPQSCSERKKEGDPSIVFMFTGQGSQYVNMGFDLYQSEPVFRETIDQCFAILKSHTRVDFREILYPSAENLEIAQSKLNETVNAQPILFIVEYALVKLWRTWGVTPDVMIGHSLGEYVAACLSGVLTLEEALILVASRGQLMQEMDSGKMLAVPLSEEEIKPFLEEHVSIAVVNHSKSIVLSGPSNSIDSISKNLEENGIVGRMLKTSHAFHSESVAKIIPEFREKLNQVNFKSPKIPFISNASGTWIKSSEVTSVDYWIKHLRYTVQFSRGILELLSNPNAIFIEVGPGKILCNLVKRHVTSDGNQRISSSLPTVKKNEEDREVLLKTLGQLWYYDVPIDWEKVYQKSNRVPLPTYPFEKKKYWIESPSHSQDTKNEVNAEKKSKDIDLLPDQNIKATSLTEAPKKLMDIEEFLIVIWKDLLGHKSIDKNDDFFQLGGDSLLAVQLLTKLENTFSFNFNVQTLFEFSTLSKLSQEIFKKMSSEDRISEEVLSQPLIKLKTGRKGKNLFLIHPIDGHVFCYKQLADVLVSDYTIYGIQSPNYTQESALSFESFEKQAAYYIQVIKKIQKNSPYFLGGFSFGGLIAYEIANQLWANDDSIGLLAMMDVIPPDSQLENANTEDQMINLLLDLFEGKPVSSDELRGLSKEGRIKRLMQSIGFGEWTFSQQERVFNQVVDHWKSLSKYQLKPYPGKILLFQAENRFVHSKNVSLEKAW
ncbi:MAG: acyltransferase domain-containing protein, partial [Nitrospirae bacterium]|nr:acyltransferase domain-containing protein [Nitrospirota bacterium]